MEPYAFDQLTRSLAHGSSRRGFLRSLFKRGASVAAVAATSSVLIDTLSLEGVHAAGTCPGDKIPLECGCGTGLSECLNDTCKDLDNDPQNCGTCGNDCGSGYICCSGTCVYPSNDRDNCGACGSSCWDPWHSCCDGSCVDVRYDADNCGSCGGQCPVGATCVDTYCQCTGPQYNRCGSANQCFDLLNGPEFCGQCSAGLGGGYTCCNGVMALLSSDKHHCGACGNDCGSGEFDACCDGVCTSLRDNDDHCGNCSNSCGVGEQCCYAGCADINYWNNCGGCNIICGTNEICQSGTCVTCPPGQVGRGNNTCRVP